MTLLARLKTILAECENDFHTCKRCGDEDYNATKESNLYLLLRSIVDEQSAGEVTGPPDDYTDQLKAAAFDVFSGPKR
jgi:hypothetical protein